MPLVTDELIQSAFDYLNEQGEAAASAKANLIIAEYRRKKTRAKIILDSGGRTQSAREAEAEASDEYERAVIKEAEAAEVVEWHRHQRARAEAIIEAWRSEQANERGLRRVA